MKRYSFSHYGISFEERTFSVWSQDVCLFRLPVSSAVDGYAPMRFQPVGSSGHPSGILRDEDTVTPTCTVTEEADGVTAEYTGASSLWGEKTYRIHATEQGFTYRVAVSGKGTVHGVRYFAAGGTEPEYEAAGYLLPHANHFSRRECLRNVGENAQLSFDYFAPCPFVYPFYTEELEGWFGLGLFAEKGCHQFDTFRYEKYLRLSVPLENRVTVDGWKELPGIWGGYGKDATDVLTAYSRFYFDTGLAKPHTDYKNAPAWWRQPIFCGWGEQQQLGRVTPVRAADHATQAEYEKMLATLDEHGIHPGTVIIDAKWQKAMGTPVVDEEKWPDLRGFVDRMHAKGRHVLLWMKSWDAEGVPKTECISKLCNPVAQDPTNPAFRQRFRGWMRTLLSGEAGCMDCDGFKVDFINCTPRGEAGELLTTWDGSSYGVELVRKWLELIRDSAKAVKPDCLLNMSCAHPYVADCADQIRLHDYQPEMRSSVEVMRWRGEIARAVYGNISLDTDSGGTGSRRDFHRYLKAQPEIGVPDLYYVSATLNVPMDEEDYRLVREIWADYRARLGLPVPE